MILCDEAQWLPVQCLQYWRYLWDDLSTQIAVVFVGGEGCLKALRSDAALWSRIYTAQQFQTMEIEEVLNVVPLFHPLWAGATQQQIADVDEKACRGNFRSWALVTRKLLQARQRQAERTPAADVGVGVDPKLLAWVLKQVAKP